MNKNKEIIIILNILLLAILAYLASIEPNVVGTIIFCFLILICPIANIWYTSIVDEHEQNIKKDNKLVIISTFISIPNILLGLVSLLVVVIAIINIGKMDNPPENILFCFFVSLVIFIINLYYIKNVIKHALKEENVSYQMKLGQYFERFKLFHFIKKYLPDILILLGILIFSYNFLRPQVSCRFGKECDLLDYGYVANHHIGNKILGIMLFSTGLILAIRRYLSNKK